MSVQTPLFCGFPPNKLNMSNDGSLSHLGIAASIPALGIASIVMS